MEEQIQPKQKGHKCRNARVNDQSVASGVVEHQHQDSAQQNNISQSPINRPSAEDEENVRGLVARHEGINKGKPDHHDGQDHEHKRVDEKVNTRELDAVARQANSRKTGSRNVEH